MGTYDYVEGILCVNCFVEIEDAQTKDGPRTFQTLKPGSIYKESSCYAEELKERRELLDSYDYLVAYGRCPKCHQMWDIFIPIIRVTGKSILSGDKSKYKYKKAEWAVSWEKMQELVKEGRR